MEIRVSINEKAVFVLLIVTAMVSAIGITIAAPPDPGHAWGDIECVGCIATANLDDGAVTSGKITDGAVTNAKIDSVAWGKIPDVPADLDDGDQVGITSETDPRVASWAKTGGTCSCGTCWVTQEYDLQCSRTYYRMCTPAGWRRMSISYDTCYGGYCFVAGTMVTMADGTSRNIEDIEVGDLVNGRVSVNTVLGINSHPVRSGIIYSINSMVEFTGDHPFLTKGGAWKVINPEQYDKTPEKTLEYVSKLMIGDVLVTEDGEEVIRSIDVVEKHPEETVYDLVLDGDMTYIANGFVVHTE